jgi:hypothetical protein
MLQSWQARRFIMPLVHRLDRCDPEDVQAADHALDVLFGGGGGDPRGFSPVLQTHVAFSELWEDPPPDAAELQARDEARLASPGLGPYLAPAFPGWARYAPDEHHNKWPETSVPILMLNGTMDPQTPIETAIAAEAQLNGPTQTFVTVPQAVHGVIGTPVATEGALPCGAQITLSFLQDPAAPPSTACLSDLLPLTFDFSLEEAQAVFGTEDAWDNAQPKVGQSPEPGSGEAAPFIDAEAVQRALRRDRPIGAGLR